MRVTFELNLRTALRWGLGLLLIWAALSKVVNLQEFYGQLNGYRLPLPDATLRLTAITLPWLELICGLLLLGNHLTAAALVWVQCLFFIFIVATGQAWFRGLNIDCGCFDLSLLGLSPQHPASRFLHTTEVAFFRAITLALAAACLLREYVHLKSPGSVRADEETRSPTLRPALNQREINQ